MYAWEKKYAHSESLQMRKRRRLLFSKGILFTLLLYTSILGIAFSGPLDFDNGKVENQKVSQKTEVVDNIEKKIGKKNLKNTVFPKQSNEPVQKKETISSSPAYMEDLPFQSRIINGNASPRGRFPYIVSLTKYGSHVCGGTLIAPDIVISAAHCANHFDNVQIGRHDVSDKSELFEVFVYEKIEVHSFYENDEEYIQLDYDFLVIKLFGRSSFPFARVNENSRVPWRPGESLHVMGWGIVDVESHEKASVLQEVEVKHILNKDCEKITGYLETEKSYKQYDLKGLISDAMICAKDDDEDACQGDSGGPLVILGDSSYGRDDLLVGIVSWGIGCAHERFPGVYARVSHQINWITEFVCYFSEESPPDFQRKCPVKVDINTGKDDSKVPNSDETSRQVVTVVIKLDRYPQETGWLIRGISGSDVKTHAFLPIGSYKGEGAKQITQEVFLEAGKEYEFIMLDAYGDGIQDSSNTVYLGSGTQGKVLAQNSGDFEHFIKRIFKLKKEVAPKPTGFPTTIAPVPQIQTTEPPTPLPSPLPSKSTTLRPILSSINIEPTGSPTFAVESKLTSAPTTAPTTAIKPNTISEKPTITPTHVPTITPTSAPTNLLITSPTMISVSLTIELRFDLFPEDVGWMIVSAEDQEVIIDSRSVGSYNVKNRLKVVKEKVLLGVSDNGSNVYNFIIRDSGNNGLCCDHGSGYYRLYVDGTYLYGGAVYGDFEQQVISVDDYMQSPAAAPFYEQTVTSSLEIELRFDLFPEEVGWIISSAEDQKTIIDSREVGSYSGDNKMKVIKENIMLDGQHDKPTKYVFAILDTGNNGLCCDHGSGHYKLYLDGKYLFGGGVYNDFEQQVFSIDSRSSSLDSTDSDAHQSTDTLPSLPPVKSFGQKKKDKLQNLIPETDTTIKISDSDSTWLSNVNTHSQTISCTRNTFMLNYYQVFAFGFLNLIILM